MRELEMRSELSPLSDVAPAEARGGGECGDFTGLPTHALENGREVLLAGDIERGRKAFEYQADNDQKLVASGGLASVSSLLRLFGVEASYSEVVAVAIKEHLCAVERDRDGAIKGELSGATTAQQRVALLEKFGLETRSLKVESIDQIAEALAKGEGVMVSVNAATLWKGLTPEGNFDGYYGNGEHNHVVGVIAVAFDPATREVVGFYVNDPAEPNGAARFVSADLMRDAVIGSEKHPVSGTMIAVSGVKRPSC